MTLGERIKQCRQRAGLSQEKVAELMGVSRQAVTKWEAGQSAPATENLFRLAEIFDTTVDLLIASGEDSEKPLAEQLFALYKADEAARIAANKAQRRKRMRMGLLVAAGYLLVYALGRIICGDRSDYQTILGLILGNDSRYYLFGWLLTSHLYWISMAISTLPALFGKYRFGFITLGVFAIAIPIGELLGPDPVGAMYGHGHKGWLIWGAMFLFAIAAGIVVEVLITKGILPRHKKKGAE